MTDLSLNINKEINAPITQVFDAWLNPEVLASFMMPMPGMDSPAVENDAKNGGAFTIVMQVGENKIPHTGKYLEISRPHKLVFTWQSPESIDDSTVTLNLTELASGKTNIELTHVKFIDEQRRDNHQGGWGNILNKLAEVVGS